jgi:hypothetical protein
MKASSYLLIIFFGMLILSCNEENFSNNNTSQIDYYFEATVVSKSDVNCHQCVIEFTSNIDSVKAIAGGSIGSAYLAIGIADELKVVGYKIKLDIRKLQNSEIMNCPTFGPSYNGIYVLRAKKIE